MESPLSNLRLLPLVLCIPVLASSIQTIIEALEECD